MVGRGGGCQYVGCNSLVILILTEFCFIESFHTTGSKSTLTPQRAKFLPEHFRMGTKTLSFVEIKVPEKNQKTLME